MILPIHIRQRYQQAHRDFQAIKFPSSVKDFGCINTNFPDTRKANGLTRFVIQYLTWKGHRATRISSSGRIVDRPEKQASGISLMTKKYIPGQTRKGTADISATIKGRSVMFEIKVGKDNPSEYQIREQQIEEAAGGKYFFTHTAEEFFEQYDGLIKQ